MAENLRIFSPVPLETRISPAESFGLTTQELQMFQGTVVSTFEQMLQSGEYDESFQKFKAAYDFRKQYNWNVESGKVIDRPNGITQAVDNMMLHANMDFFGLAEERRRAPLNDIFRHQLVTGMREASQLNRGIIALSTTTRSAGIDLIKAKPEDITGILTTSMETYWDRTGFPEPERFK